MLHNFHLLRRFPLPVQCRQREQEQEQVQVVAVPASVTGCATSNAVHYRRLLAVLLRKSPSRFQFITQNLVSHNMILNTRHGLVHCTDVGYLASLSPSPGPVSEAFLQPLFEQPSLPPSWIDRHRIHSTEFQRHSGQTGSCYSLW